MFGIFRNKRTINVLIIFDLSVRVLQTGVHGDEDGAAGVEGELHSFKLETLDVVGDCVLDGVDLLRHHTQHSHLNPDSHYYLTL